MCRLLECYHANSLRSKRINIFLLRTGDTFMAL